MSKIKKRIIICLAICLCLALCIVVAALIKVFDKEEPIIVEETPYVAMEDDEDFMNEVKDDDSFLLHLENTNRYREADNNREESDGEGISEEETVDTVEQ